MSANGPLPIKSGASRLAGPCLTGLEWRAETLTLLLALFVVTYGALRQLHAHERSIWRVAGIQDRVCDYTRQSYQVRQSLSHRAPHNLAVRLAIATSSSMRWPSSARPSP